MLKPLYTILWRLAEKNYSLTLAVWKEETVDNVTTRTIYKEATTITFSYSYPSHEIDNLVSSASLSSDITYYLQGSGTLKSFYYGILLEDLAEVAITGLKTHRVITATFSESI